MDDAEKKIQFMIKSTGERRKSAHVKLKLLVHGIRDNPQLFSRHIGVFKEEHYAYDNGNWGVDKKRATPSEILLPGGIVSKLHIREDSPLSIEDDTDGNLYIMKGNAVLSEASFLKRPHFWDYKTSMGIPTKDIAQIYGLSALNFNIFSGCEFHAIGKPCLFCSVSKTVDENSPIRVIKDMDAISDVCELATKYDHISYLIMTGGSYVDRDIEFDRNVQILEKIRFKLPWNGKIIGNVSFLPPKDIGKLAVLYELKVSNPSFNIEVWPENNFAKVCPGKSAYVGFSHIIESLKFLVSIYGAGKVWSNFVAGLISLEDLKAGFDFMAENGIVPGANIYHAEVGSVIGRNTEPIRESYILSVYHYLAELYAKYDYRPYFDAGVLRNSLANEVYEGWL